MGFQVSQLGAKNEWENSNLKILNVEQPIAK